MWERGLLSGPHIILLLIIILLLFGSKRIPDLARSLGRSIGEFKKGRAEGEASAREATKTAASETGKSATPPADTTKLVEK